MQKKCTEDPLLRLTYKKGPLNGSNQHYKAANTQEIRSRPTYQPMEQRRCRGGHQGVDRTWPRSRPDAAWQEIHSYRPEVGA
jgi:hypothetical protein